MHDLLWVIKPKVEGNDRKQYVDWMEVIKPGNSSKVKCKTCQKLQKT